MFSVTSATTRLNRMMTWFASLQGGITDFIIGSVTRTKFEAIAVEMEAQDYQIYQGIQAAIPVAVYESFGFSLLPASYAYGDVKFSASIAAPSGGIVIPSGTKVASSVTGISYSTTATAVILEGDTDVVTSVTCDIAGTVGNTEAGTITRMVSSVSGVTAVTNTLKVSTGTDIESDAARELRFQRYIASLSRGTVAALEYAALQAVYLTEKVVAVKVVPAEEQNPVAPGLPLVYLWNGTGTASAGLISAAQKIIDGYIDTDGNLVDGYKAAGDVVTISSATSVPIDVTATITVLSNYSLASITTAAEAAIATYLLTLGLGDTVLVSAIVERLMMIPGVYNVTGLTVNSGTTDVVLAADEAAVTGTNSLTVEY